MADTKISALTDGVTAEAADRLPAARGSPSNVWITPEYIKDYIRGLANTFTAGQTIALGTITDPATILALTATWNDAADTFDALDINVTNTNSHANSRLINLRVGGTSQFSVTRSGAVSAAGNLATTGGSVQIGNNAGAYYLGSSSDVIISRDAANILAQRNGTNAQAFRVYNTYTDASNYERGFLRWASNTLQIGSEAAGTGSARNVDFYTAGFVRLRIASTGPTTIFAGLLLQTSDLLRMGGTSASFPALKRNAAALETKLADDSAYAQHNALIAAVVDGITAPTATSGLAKIFVDTADGDLKVIFGDGTVKTIVVDT